MAFISNLFRTLSRVSRHIRRVVSGPATDEAPETALEVDSESHSIIALCEKLLFPIVKSESSASPASVKFTNMTDKIIQTWWINYRGEENFYTTILPGETYTQHTYVEHPWTFKVDGALGRLAVAKRLVSHVYSRVGGNNVTKERTSHRRCLDASDTIKNITLRNVIWRSSIDVRLGSKCRSRPLRRVNNNCFVKKIIVIDRSLLARWHGQTINARVPCWLRRSLCCHGAAKTTPCSQETFKLLLHHFYPLTIDYKSFLNLFLRYDHLKR